MEQTSPPALSKAPSGLAYCGWWDMEVVVGGKGCYCRKVVWREGMGALVVGLMLMESSSLHSQLW